MAQYIDKSALVAEIERLKTIYNDDGNIHHVAKYNILVDILSFLNTLEVKEVQEEPISEDLEEAAIMHYKDVMEYKVKTGLKPAYMTSFKAGAKWQKERIISKACEWLKENATYVHPRKGVETCMVNLTAFKEAMEE